MEVIRPFSIEAFKQTEFEETLLKMINDFLEELPRIKTSELGNDSRCMICQQEYGLTKSDADTIIEAEEAVRLPCGHHAGQNCISIWLQPDKGGDSCPTCRRKFFVVVPWPHIVPDRKSWGELKYFVPNFDDICLSLFRSDYTLENIGTGLRGISPPGWIVRAPGRFPEKNESLRGFFRDHEFRRTFARRILSTSPMEVENAAWMLQVYPGPGELEAHVEALASVLETADPEGVIYIQLRGVGGVGGATIHQVDTHTYSNRPEQDEGIFRSIVLRGALDGSQLIKEGRQGSWWAYLGYGDDLSTHELTFWRETGDQEYDSESDLDFHEGIDDPDKDGENGA